MQAMPTRAPAPDDDACYLALKAHDARFDGSFFTGVTSTGIYCRPVCRVRTPRRENCRFFTLAAQAEQAGFRPCLRCRPELAPGANTWSTQDASGMLARQAARLLDDPAAWPDAAPAMTALAARLGVSDRHLRRIFEAQLGVSPLQYLQTRRLLTAKQLLTDTDLPVTAVALASGFASLRRFNAAFAAHYGLNPTRLRREGRTREGAGVAVQLGYRPPYDIAAMLGFFARRCIDGQESVTGEAEYAVLGRTLCLQAGARTHTGWLTIRFDPARQSVLLRVSDSLCEVLPLVISRVRALLDLDADPAVINAGLSSSPIAQHGAFALDASLAGLRVPGCLDGFELAVRAILGQQITVAAARTLGQRLVAALRRAARDALARAQPPVPDGAGAGPGQRRRAGAARHRAPAAGGHRGPGASDGTGTVDTRWQRRCHRHPGRAEGPARHRRLDGAVHRHACAALARRLSRRRRGAAKGAGRGLGARGRTRLPGLAALAQLRRGARLAPGGRAAHRKYYTINSKQCP